jgi:hypothetical protein
MMISLGNFRINYIPGLDQTTDTETVLLFWVISQIDTNAAYKQKTQGTKPKWKHSKGSFSDKSMIRKKMLLINTALVYFSLLQGGKKKSDNSVSSKSIRHHHAYGGRGFCTLAY